MEERGTPLSVVVDCSAFGALILDDEADHVLPGLQRCVVHSEAVVPAHFMLEVASAIQTAIRRQRMPLAGAEEVSLTIASLPITVDQDTNRNLWSGTWKLAERHHLTVYDAAYLELALRLGATLATKDKALRNAAWAEDVELFGR